MHSIIAFLCKRISAKMRMNVEQRCNFMNKTAFAGVNNVAGTAEYKGEIIHIFRVWIIQMNQDVSLYR